MITPPPSRTLLWCSASHLHWAFSLACNSGLLRFFSVRQVSEASASPFFFGINFARFFAPIENFPLYGSCCQCYLPSYCYRAWFWVASRTSRGLHKLLITSFPGTTGRWHECMSAYLLLSRSKLTPRLKANTRASANCCRGGTKIEEGGVGAHIECGYLARIMNVLAFQGGLGACSPGKFLKFRPYESTSVAVGNHHNHAKFSATGL